MYGTAEMAGTPQCMRARARAQALGASGEHPFQVKGERKVIGDEWGNREARLLFFFFLGRRTGKEGGWRATCAVEIMGETSWGEELAESGLRRVR